ncbi:type II secretion system F family protein [Marivita sp. S2033]|uniref:type II secretion system F family protein n=1 Tax=Marivita sp. S2033 TaxID=3373187 RepID=UPI00398224DD
MTLTLALFAALSAVFIGLVLALLVLADRQRRRHVARLMRLRPDKPEAAVATKRKARPTYGQAGIIRFIERQLVQTNLRVNVVELLVQVSLGILALYSILVLLAGMTPLLAIALAVIVPLGAAALFIRVAKTRYRAAFTEQLPEALDVFARGLRAGRPISDSLGIVVDTSKGPVQREFSRCRDEMCMGTTLPDTLAGLEARIPTAEISFFSVATSLQAETGGNLIETMEALANQLRERRKLRKKARALSSEARASAAILAALPFAVGLSVAFLNGAYLAPLYTDPRGQIMSGIAVSSIALGMFMMTRMGKLDV